MTDDISASPQKIANGAKAEHDKIVAAANPPAAETEKKRADAPLKS